MKKILKAADSLDQAAFFIVVGTALGVGTCWALAKVLVSKTIFKICADNRAK